MYRTFNCGIGMVVVVAAEQAQLTIDSLTAAGEEVVVIGNIEPHDGGEQVVIHG
jgi:phosphoribosylformylglycinamidine cyclo-ligase